MAEFFTRAAVKAKVQDDLDLEAEDFVDDDEFNGYINEAIDIVEAMIHKLGVEDAYFLKWAYLPLTTGSDSFDLPTDIYANKIRGITYDDGSLIYEIKRVRGMHLFNKIINAQHFSNSDDYYQYILINQTAGLGSKGLLVPDSRVTSSLTGLDGAPEVKIWYIRQAQRVTADTDVIDLPDCQHAIIKYVEWKIMLKESHPNMGVYNNQWVEEKNELINTLAEMVPDQDTEIVPDFDMYTDIS